MPARPERIIGSPAHVALWETINRYANAWRFPAGATVERMKAVPDVEAALSRLSEEIAEEARAEEREACAKIVEAFPDCDCRGFCECYGRSSFPKLADEVRSRPSPREPEATR